MWLRSFPLLTGRLIVDVGSNIPNLFVRKPAAEGGHRILAVGDLIDDGGLLEAASEVLLEGRFLESLLGLNDVITSCVAGGAVTCEDLRAILEVSSVGGLTTEKSQRSEGGGHLRGCRLKRVRRLLICVHGSLVRAGSLQSGVLSDHGSL